MAASFANRTQAGQALVEPVRALRLADPVVLALPRGGVPVALELARALKAPLDLLLVRKIGAPGQPELAVAVVVDGAHPEIVIHEATQHLAGVDRTYIEREAQRELAEIRRHRRVYLQGRAPIAIPGRNVIVVDDGIATGTTRARRVAGAAPPATRATGAGRSGGPARRRARAAPRGGPSRVPGGT